MSSQHSKRTSGVEALFVGLAFWLIAAFTLALGLKGWFLPVASRHGPGIDQMILYLLITTGAIFVIGHLLLGYFVWKFARASRVTHRRPRSRTERIWSIGLGIVMAVIAEGGVLVLGMPVWNEFYAMSPPSDAVQVEITGEQFAWNIRYPGADGVFGSTRPELISGTNPLGLDEKDPAAADDLLLLGLVYLPVNEPAHFRLKSKDVIHGLYLPEFRVKQDAVPGMEIDIWFVPTLTGSYEIACTELCGFGHFQMRGVLEVVTREEYDRFLEDELPFLGG